MTYGIHLRQCSGYCSGWQSFGLNFRPRTMQLQPLESALHCFRRGMDVPLRNDNAAMSGDPHDGKGVHSRFSQPCQHGMTKRVQNEIVREEWPASAFDFRRYRIPVQMVD
jgi:hypothetical protein